MRIVLAGASGFLGTALVARLSAGGHDVVRLVRRAAKSDGEYRWDPTAGFVPEEALAGADAVVNLCGAPLIGARWTHARKQILRDSRTTPTEVLSNVVATHHIPVFVNASAVGYYGHTGDAVVDEKSKPGKGFLADLCQEWEAATTVPSQARIVLLRTGIVLGADGGLLRMLAPLTKSFLGAKFGAGTQYYPWISLTDEIRAIEFALTHDISGPVNLTAPTPVTNAELTAAIGVAVKRPAFWVIPAFVVRVLFGELGKEGILDGQRAVPTALQEAGFTFSYPELAQALAAELADRRTVDA
jgi:uncharacterized protein (TIGR01777 family)